MQKSPKKAKTNGVDLINPEEHVIELKVNMRSETLPSVICSCGWKSEPNRSLMRLGREAKNHAMETGHQLRTHNV